MQFITEKALCLHCGSVAKARSSFCCSGCESVYELLQSKGLSHFYDLKKSLPRAKPLEKFLLESPQEVQYDAETARFYLKGIHCLGCLWLLEKLPEIEPKITRSSLDFVHQILEIDKKNITWNEVVALIRKLGYEPKLLDEENKCIQEDQREQLTRIGVAGFCAGNIMLLSVSIYSGADPLWANRFSWLSFLLCIPVFFYSASPVFRASFFPLKQGRLSVDLAISLALLSGMVMSMTSLVFGNGKEIYFDSLSMLVFLLLSSRYFLNRLKESVGKETPYLSYLNLERYARLLPTPSIVAADALQVGDIFLLKKNQVLPLDGKLMSSAFFDLSLLTGESAPIELLAGDSIDSGAKLISSESKIQIIRDAENSRLSKILSQIKTFQISRSKTLDFSEKMGKYFVLFVLTIAGISLAIQNDSEGFRRVLAFVIVTCPCVLALAVPLAYTRALQIAARKGILFRNPEKLESLAEVRHVFLDKTGTLTSGSFQVNSWENIEGEANLNKDIIFSLEAQSTHPIAKAIVRHLGERKNIPLTNYKEFFGGLRAEYISSVWELKAKSGASTMNQIGLYRDGQLQTVILLGDSLREDSASCVQALKDWGLSTTILSGDREANVLGVAKALGIERSFANISPEEKAKIIQPMPNSIMVGDGANDGVAFQAAAVGIAVQGSMEISLKNSDITFTKPGLSSLIDVLKIAKNTHKIIRFNFAFTLFYNIAAGLLALTGMMSPLLAAVFMPMSALTVFLFTQWQTNKEFA